MDIKDTLKAILTKQMSVEEALSKSTPEQRDEIEVALAYMNEMQKANKEFYDYESTADESSEKQGASPKKYQGGDPRHAERGNTRAGNIRPPAISDGSSKLKMPHTGISEKGAKVRNIETFKGEMCKFDKNGQWKIEKKDAPTLNYAEINKKPDNKSIEANAPTLNYAEMNKPANQPAKWKQTSTPQSKKEAWMKVNRARNELVGRGLKKNDGVLLDHALKNPERMVAKDELRGYGTPGINAPMMAEPLSKPPVSEAQRKAMWAAAGGHSNLGIPQSVGKDFAEADPGGKLPKKKKMKKGEEPHKDDPHHEAKEVDKANKIKEKAEELLDMHKKS